MNEKKKSLFALHFSSLLFGGTGLFAKLIDLPVIDITAVRTLIASAGLFILLKITKQRIALDSFRDYAIMLVQGILMGLHWVTFFYSIQISSVAVGMISLFTYPIITIFLEPLWRGQKPHLSDIMCGALVLFGVYLMVPEFSFDNTVTRGVCWGIFSAFMFSLRNVIQHNYLSEYRGDTSMMYQCFIAGICGMIFITPAACSINAMTWLKLVVLATVFYGYPPQFFCGQLALS